MTSFFFNLAQPKDAPVAAKTAANDKKKKPEEKITGVPPDTVSLVRSFFHIDCSQLTFKDLSEGRKGLQLELVAFAFDEQGRNVDQHGRSFTLSFDAKGYEQVMKDGLIYRTDIPLKKPGAYQFRAVLRDPESKRLGSAGQFLQIPDLTRKRLAISGLLLASADTRPATQTVNTENGEAASQPPDLQGTAAIRRFSRTGTLDYGFMVYNADTNAAAKLPQLTSQVEIYREGKLAYQGPARPVALGANATSQRVECVGQLKLTGFPPGDYMLHVIVTDTLAKRKYAKVDQWMDFSVR
jgi:hypothetical protein